MRTPLLLLFAVSLGCSDSTSLQGEPKRSQAEAVFEQEGKTYLLINGDMFRDDSNRLTFIDHWYDPEFYDKHFVQRDALIYQRDPESDELYLMHRHFTEDFERADRLSDLMTVERGWTNMALQSPKTPSVEESNALVNQVRLGEATFVDNRVEPSGEVVHDGERSLKCVCVPKSSSMVTGKASIASFFVHFLKGDDIWFRGWFYLADGGKPFTLMDLESSWIKQHPGMRICLSDDRLFVELKWAGKPAHKQAAGREMIFPTGKWVQLKLHLTLTDSADGVIELWQDGKQIIDSRGQTLPLAGSVYDSLEVGISAHNDTQAATLFVDDIAISAEPLE